ncbi:copper amine oxidase domain protein [Paenibacillus vortex V453]|uniref:Copper amine oxidase domain protein n=1 Tax=Paenibacillus vortex V453 TaxID=715225 RepID=A0A2R9T0W7_9BACL|nr:hypothetical protein [Paenibacillus vortex]EFU43206.1 copper amine oxidase domain protein [Paenibacillus vortex V453]
MKTMKHTTTPLTRTLAAAGLAGILMISASGLSSSHVHAETRTAASTDQAETPAITPPLVTSKTLQSKEKWLATDIKIPVFQGLADTKYQERAERHHRIPRFQGYGQMGEGSGRNSRQCSEERLYHAPLSADDHL